MILSKLTIVCLGKCKEAYWRDACAEYQKRLGGFCKLNVVELEPERLPESPSAAQVEQALAREAERITAKIPVGATTVALCIEGTKWSSEQLADRLQSAAVGGNSHVVFLIGSSYGLADSVKRAARFRISMSDMTFPHQLARVMLLEQLYRAMKLLGGGTYHK